MNKKSGRILHGVLISTFVFTATFIISKNSDILSNSKSISTASNNGYLQENVKASDNIDVPEASTAAAQQPAPPAPTPSPEPAATLPPPEPTAVTTAPSNKTAKAPSTSTSSQTKTQKAAATPKPAAYTLSSNGRSYSISAEERNLFARLVSAEAAGESYEGKLAVATVVINRVTSDIFPGNVTQVIMGKEAGYYQFTPVLDGRINNPPTADAVKAVDQVLGGHRSFSAKIMWFLNPQKSTSGWIINNKTFFKTIGNHDFYF